MLAKSRAAAALRVHRPDHAVAAVANVKVLCQEKLGFLETPRRRTHHFVHEVSAQLGVLGDKRLFNKQRFISLIINRSGTNHHHHVLQHLLMDEGTQSM